MSNLVILFIHFLVTLALSLAKTLLGFEIKSLEPIVAVLLHVLHLDHVPTPKNSFSEASRTFFALVVTSCWKI
jgi:hypothetical protein